MSQIWIALHFGIRPSRGLSPAVWIDGGSRAGVSRGSGDPPPGRPLSAGSRGAVLSHPWRLPNAGHRVNAVIMLGQRRRRWHNINTTLAQISCLLRDSAGSQEGRLLVAWRRRYVGTVLGQRRRRWPNVGPPLGQCILQVHVRLIVTARVQSWRAPPLYPFTPPPRLVNRVAATLRSPAAEKYSWCIPR